ncbi:unknown [Methanothermobacter thermautotrophicus str. Delta H]|uniref:Uncharacterized protein n=1 Tax=Methanothermobacter thermautotrophicus (strain ATCC 29096 / DSM 1053 / JCM 10044 / NBRC 100330 / Delta H) TaxID=187420 RepID=O26828_METTH|nr:unknown [Methanothermobacter thermautotrophicus str. Delta H]
MNRLGRLLALIFIFNLLIGPVSATMNVIVITDPTGADPNGAAAGSMSFAQNMFQSTFLMSKEKRFAVLSGGEGAFNTEAHGNNGRYKPPGEWCNSG